MSLAGDAVSEAVKFGAGHMALVGGLALAVGLLSGYALWHHTVYQEGYQACKAEVSEATNQAKADHDAQQARIDQGAEQERRELQQRVQAQQALVDKLVAEAQHPPQVFAKDCTLPAEQVSAYNSIK